MIENWMDYKGLVGRQAQRLQTPAIDQDELFTVGLYGLYRAATEYEPSKPFAFETHATKAIRREMIDYMRQLMGRRGKYANTKRIPHGRTIADAGQQRVDDRDELRHLGVDPDGRPRRFCTLKPIRDGLGLSAWARRLGLTPEGLRNRIERWGLDRALSTPKGAA